MSDGCSHCPELDASDSERSTPSRLSRSGFMRRLGMVGGLLALGKILPAGFTPVQALAAGTQATARATGALLGNVKSLRPNASLAYTDPRSGDPAVLIRLANGRYVSYDAVCTHAGCTVPYDARQRLLVCPCHGAKYDPARGAAVVGGPAPQPLTRLPIQVDAAGNVYALNAKPGSVKPGSGLRPPPAPGTGGGDEGDDGATRKAGAHHRHPRRGGDD